MQILRAALSLQVNKTQNVYEIHKENNTVLDVMAILGNIFYLLQQTVEKSESNLLHRK